MGAKDLPEFTPQPLDKDYPAYSLDLLGRWLKEAGLSQAEEGAEMVAAVIFFWFNYSANKSETLADDMLIGAVNTLKRLVAEQTDKISPN